MSRIPEPGWTSGRPRIAGPSSRASRPVQRSINPQLLIHVRPLSSSRVTAAEGGSGPSLKPPSCESNQVSSNMRSSLNRLHKKLSSKGRTDHPRVASPGAPRSIPMRRRDSTTPDSKQIEGSPRQVAIICEDLASHMEASSKDLTEPTSPVSSPVCAIEEATESSSCPALGTVTSETEPLKSWDALQEAFRKYETSTGHYSTPANEPISESAPNDDERLPIQGSEINATVNPKKGNANGDSSEIHVPEHEYNIPPNGLPVDGRLDDSSRVNDIIGPKENVEHIGPSVTNNETVNDDDQCETFQDGALEVTLQCDCSESADFDSGKDDDASLADGSQNSEEISDVNDHFEPRETSNSVTFFSESDIECAPTETEPCLLNAVAFSTASSESQCPPDSGVSCSTTDPEKPKFSLPVHLPSERLAQADRLFQSMPPGNVNHPTVIASSDQTAGHSSDGRSPPSIVLDNSAPIQPNLSKEKVFVSQSDDLTEISDINNCIIENKILDMAQIQSEHSPDECVAGSIPHENISLQESVGVSRSKLGGNPNQVVSRAGTTVCAILAPVIPISQGFPLSPKAISADDSQFSDLITDGADLPYRDAEEVNDGVSSFALYQSRNISKTFAQGTVLDRSPGMDSSSCCERDVNNTIFQECGFNDLTEPNESLHARGHVDSLTDKPQTQSSEENISNSCSRLRSVPVEETLELVPTSLSCRHSETESNPAEGCNRPNPEQFVLQNAVQSDQALCGTFGDTELSVNALNIGKLENSSFETECQDKSLLQVESVKPASGMCSLQRVSLLEPFPPKINVRKLRRSHSAPFKLSSCHTFMPYLDDIGIGKEAIKAVVTSNEDKGCIFNEELSDQVHLVRNQIHDALRMSRSEKSKKPKPRAVLYRRRYRRTALPEQQELKSVELADRSLDCAVLDSRQPENLECAVLDSRHPENPQPEIQYDNLPISPSTDQEVQTSSCNECCREMRCSRCPVMMDSSTESLITVSHIQIQCQADYQDSEAQCCTIGCADSTMQTDIAELCQQSMQTESALHSEDSSTQTVRIESFGQAVQCSVAREQMETQTVNTFADSMVQCTESDIGKLTTSGSKLQQDFSDLNQHVDQFIRSISPGRSTLQERQKRQYIDLIEDPDKGVLVLDDGRSLKVAGPMGPRSLVSLNVGGQRFDVLRSTLARYPETLLGRIANSPLPVYIDRSPTLFPLIIDTYRTGSAYVATAYQTTTFLETLRDEARFYQIEQRMFPNGIQSVYDPATHQSSTVRNLVDSAGNGSISLDKDRLSEDEEGQCNQFELFERCVLVPGMSATFTPRTNETLILDTICGKGQLLLDAEHNYRPELSIHGAVAFDSAAYLNSSEEDVFNIGTTYPHGASYTFFMLDMQHKRAGEQESTIDEDISCDFCGLLQHTDPGIGRMPICTACHSRLPDKESQAGRRTPSGFNSSTKVEKREQLTITMRIVCTFDKKCRAKVSTLKKGNVTVISKAAIEAKQHAPRGKSPAKRSKQIPSANVPEKQQPLIRQTSSASTKINKQMKPSPLPLIRRPPMV